GGSVCYSAKEARRAPAPLGVLVFFYRRLGGVSRCIELRAAPSRRAAGPGSFVCFGCDWSGACCQPCQSRSLGA
ncbi:unnamed protein product, partial [Amoebophrya sp. A120]